MSWHYEPIARTRYSIRCLGELDHHGKTRKPCTFQHDDAESAGRAEEIAREHIDATPHVPDDYETPYQDHTVLITPVTMVSRHID